ncbi:MAG: ATP-binding cassette domain-containing protein [Azoarcus sp.]|jgi:D-methionine transport system ATP-binding protein|nr:ATP-binding cassette domain-containing protein [Azoarcus sp.]
MNTRAAVLEFQDVSKHYRAGQQDVPALRNIDLRVEAGEVFGIIGRSGAGKSTLIRLINALERPDRGKVWVEDADVSAMNAPALRALRQKIGMIFQHFNLLSSKTVAQNVAFPLRIAGQSNEAAVQRRVSALLERVGLLEHARKYPAQLSGGQKQRVGIARALATGPRILLCDEATSALDPQTTQSVLHLLDEIHRELQLTIVVIAHEMNVIRALCDRVAVLDEGKIVETGETAEIFLHPKHPVSRHFVSESENIDEERLDAAFDRVEGSLARLTFRGEQVYEALFGKILREYGVDFCIVSGHVDRIGNMPYGRLVMGLRGARTHEALDEIRREGITIEILR